MDPQDNRQPGSAPRPQPTSAPAVPKELLSARPAMTRVRPQSPEKMAEINRARERAQAQPAPKQLTPEEAAEREERLEYLRNLRDRERGRKKGGGKKWLVVLIALVVLAGLGAGAYWFLGKSSKPTPVATNNTSQTQPQQQAQTPANPQPQQSQAEMKDYQSTNFTVAFKYPADWTVSDTAQKLTITSPKQTLTDPNGQQIEGQVVVMIRPKQTSLPEFKAGNAVAVLDSKKLTYTQPAAGQRGETYVSYLQYAQTTIKGTLDAMYVTGNSGYQKGQAVPQVDVTKVDPLINVYFVKCADGTTCSTTAPATGVKADAWTASDLNKTVEAILQSLAIS